MPEVKKKLLLYQNSNFENKNMQVVELKLRRFEKKVVKNLLLES